MFRFITAGESHGPALTTIVEGAPAGLELRAEHVDVELRRRQGGYGRGGRMRIESDRAEILSGVRFGETLGSPITLQVRNRDWENWTVAMSREPLEAPGPDDESLRRVHHPRPGHADLVGVLKYARSDARDILERASARETTARVAAGAVAKRMLEELGIRIGSHVVMLGGIEAAPVELPADLNAAADVSPVRCLDPEAEGRMIDAIDAAKRDGDTLGGVFEVVATGVPLGLGSHVSWDRKLDGRLAGALMSIQAMKGVEIGLGFEAAARPGSRVHDAIVRDPAAERGAGYGRSGNHAGGLEGGITTGQPLVCRVAMKPISTLMQPLDTVDLRTGESVQAVRERSDVCALPAAGVVGEAMVALVLAHAVLEKFGGDSMVELRRHWEGHLELLRTRFPAS